MGALRMWTVYDNPSDFPVGMYVAREYVIGLRDDHEPVTTGRIKASLWLDKLREELSDMGLVALHRDPTDDPVIVESWL